MGGGKGRRHARPPFRGLRIHIAPPHALDDVPRDVPNGVSE